MSRFGLFTLLSDFIYAEWSILQINNVKDNFAISPHFMHKQISSIAIYTVLEALRNRLSWLIIIVLFIGVGLSGFLNALALTESQQTQVALLAAFLRFAAAFLLATFVVTSMVREFNDKGLELLLSLALPRAAYLLGKFLGFALLAIVPACLFGLLTLLASNALQSALWTISLVCELWIIVAFAMLCVLSFNQIMAALSATLGFYLLARSITALQLIAKEAQVETSNSQQVMGALMNAIAAVIPHLDQFTKTDWLVYHTGQLQDLNPIAIQSTICVGLLVGAGLFDLYRKNI